jgi:hypothetical protein
MCFRWEDEMIRKGGKSIRRRVFDTVTYCTPVFKDASGLAVATAIIVTGMRAF